MVGEYFCDLGEVVFDLRVLLVICVTPDQGRLLVEAVSAIWLEGDKLFTNTMANLDEEFDYDKEFEDEMQKGKGKGFTGDKLLDYAAARAAVSEAKWLKGKELQRMEAMKEKEIQELKAVEDVKWARQQEL